MIKQEKLYINLNYNQNIPDNLYELKSTLKHFECGEFEFSIQENITNKEITIFQSFQVGNFNDDLMKLKIICDVLNKNNVNKISYIAPFLPYTRQDKTNDKSTSLGSKILANIINDCNISEITTYDLHNLQIEQLFRCKINHLSMIPKFIEHIKQNFNTKDITIVFPDFGAVKRFEKLFTNENFNIITINKNRFSEGMEMQISDNIKNRTTIIIDDIIDQGDTAINACNLLLQYNAKEVNVYATHGVLSGNAVNKIDTSLIKEIVLSNSIAHNNSQSSKKIKYYNC